MAFMKASPRVAAILEDALAKSGATRCMLFGCPSYTLMGNLFAGVFGEQVFLRLPEAGRVRAVSEGAGTFEPLKGRALKMYVLLSEAAVTDDEVLSTWLERSMDFVKGLPKRPRKRSKLARKHGK